MAAIVHFDRLRLEREKSGYRISCPGLALRLSKSEAKALARELTEALAEDEADS